MTVYRVDAFEGAVTETVAVFFDCNELHMFLSAHPYSNFFGYVEIEVPDFDWNILHGKEPEKYIQVPHKDYK